MVNMNLSISFCHAVLLGVSLLLSSPSHAVEVNPSASVMRMGGTGSALGTMALLAEAFKKTHPQASIVIVPSLGSGGGIMALQASTLDIALTSRPLKPNERSQNFVAMEYGRTPLVFATASRTNVAAMTTPELVAIYAGERKTWPDGRALRLVLRPDTESNTETLKSISAEMKQAVSAAQTRTGMIMAPTDKDNADSIENIPGALGTTTLAQIISEKRGLQAMVFNGVTPSLNTLADGKYPYYKPLFMVTALQPSALTQQFVAFVSSAAGREILQRNGHLLAPAKEKP
jgi:phosphate transport system substrate-binding protein